MPGQTRFSLSSLEKEAIDLKDRGVGSVLLFGIPNHKDDNGSNAYDPEGIVQKSIESLKGQLDDEIVIGTDVCLCQYTSHGHCGIVKDGLVENDETLKRLAGTAVSHARAGADLVAPSAMIDGQVAAIREALDDNGFKDTGILAYAAKHSSSLFGQASPSLLGHYLSRQEKIPNANGSIQRQRRICNAQSRRQGRMD